MITYHNDTKNIGFELGDKETLALIKAFGAWGEWEKLNSDQEYCKNGRSMLFRDDLGKKLWYFREHTLPGDEGYSASFVRIPASPVEFAFFVKLVLRLGGTIDHSKLSSAQVERPSN